MRTLVVGAGAVGGYFGGRLVEAGRDITFLMRARRGEELKARGLRIVSPHGDLTLHPRAIRAQQIGDPYDLILLGVKSYSLAKAINEFTPAAGTRSLILLVLNGLRHIDLLAGRFGKSLRVRWSLPRCDGNR